MELTAILTSIVAPMPLKPISLSALYAEDVIPGLVVLHMESDAMVCLEITHTILVKITCALSL